MTTIEALKSAGHRVAVMHHQNKDLSAVWEIHSDGLCFSVSLGARSAFYIVPWGRIGGQIADLDTYLRDVEDMAVRVVREDGETLDPEDFPQ